MSVITQVTTEAMSTGGSLSTAPVMSIAAGMEGSIMPDRSPGDIPCAMFPIPVDGWSGSATRHPEYGTGLQYCIEQPDTPAGITVATITGTTGRNKATGAIKNTRSEGTESLKSSQLNPEGQKAPGTTSMRTAKGMSIEDRTRAGSKGARAAGLPDRGAAHPQAAAPGWTASTSHGREEQAAPTASGNNGAPVEIEKLCVGNFDGEGFLHDFLDKNAEKVSERCSKAVKNIRG